MSNDTTYELRFVAPRRDLLEQVIQYLERKKERWEAWKRRGKYAKGLLERVGGTHFGVVVSWGFDFGEIEEYEDGEASVIATSWANEIPGNVHISGKESELADLIEKFPYLDLSGTYQGEYGDGDIDGSDYD